ncbi:hypothetical protein FFWV33_05720 [Flavobacterium faecale]|uniref:Lipid A deacylase LpxR family protein n=1 Tax=Flavobacterium faecale TaxID=1355330 RepID=A0A2S1LBD8_9FLAO|nr:lipid A deacylase LpxR family protein [Flavobacterium faecale]AWG21065.1 hypothetical protein FFWV33_05720 [Flavobacterium faecale]
MKIFFRILSFFLLCSTTSWSQKNNAEIGLVTDNDLYTSSKNDMYYTNGLELFYRHIVESQNPEVAKKTVTFKVGQYIYTPRFVNTPEISIMDRPYAGYLFGELGQSLFFKKESVFQADVRLGYLGPNSFGRQTQNNFHKIVGYPKLLGWEHQIQNALAIQTHFLYSKKLFRERNNQFTDVHFRSEANLGTIFTGVSTGLITRIGFKKLTRIYDSNLYGASVGSNESEFYAYVSTSVNYQLYDATIEGSLFNNNSPVTFDLVPFRFNGEAGIKYRKNNLNLYYTFMYRGRELVHPTNTGYFYGSVGISYLLNTKNKANKKP